MSAVAKQKDAQQNDPANLVHAPGTHASGIDFAERIESLKAGILAATSTVLAFGVLSGGHGWLQTQFAELLGLQVRLLELPIAGAIAALSGFLFGVTYRYVIRQDRNPHLRSGAVLAFGLVRGLAQLDSGLQAQRPLLPLLVMAGESVLLFALARMVLDWALVQNWVKTFRGLPE